MPETRSQTHGAHSSHEVPVRPNPRRRRQMIHQSVLNMKGQIVALEGKDVLIETQRQAVLRISKMLESMCCEFKAYHYDIDDSLDSDEEPAREQTVFDEHQRKTMEYISTA